ncbi:MAG TPA: HEAT repeat domain-containing protein [Abditibacteriaceae bacterium]|jgi:hypothetical protein
MSKEIQKLSDENAASFALAKIGLSDRQSRAATGLRYTLSWLKEFGSEQIKQIPIYGPAVAATVSVIEKASDEEADAEIENMIERLLGIGQQTNDDMRALNAIVGLLFSAVIEQGSALSALTASFESCALPPAEAAQEIALAAYRNRVARAYHYAEYRGIEPGSERVASLPLDDVYVVPRLKVEQSRAIDHEREQDLIARLHNRDLTDEEKARCELEYLRLVGERWHPGGKSEESGLSLGEALHKSHHAVVKGTPGAGKSTLIRYVARACVAGENTIETLRWMADFTPVVLPLAAFAEARRQPENHHLPLLGFLKMKMRDLGGAALETALTRELEAGRVLVLLDGVDEIPEDDRELAVRSIDDFLLDFESNRVLVTSRPYGYVRLAGEVSHFDLPHFSPEQVEEFVVKWQRAFERSLKPDAPDWDKAATEAQETLKEIRSNPRVADLATNPLLLVVISLIRHGNIKLPEKRVELYQAAVRTLMGSWNKFRALAAREVGGTELPFSRLLSTWAAVAHWMRRDESTVVRRARLQNQLEKVLREKQYDDNADAAATAESYLDAAANRAGLLEERGPDYFAFWHPTFEEFLAAHDMVKPASRAVEKLLPRRDDARWREVILLAVGIIGVLNGDEETAGEIVEAIAFEDNGPLEELLYPHLRLAAACVTDDAGVPRHVSEKIIFTLAQVIHELPYAPLTTAFIQTAGALPNLRPAPATINVLAPLAKQGDWEVAIEATRLISNAAPKNITARQLCGDLLNDAHSEVSLLAAFGLARCGNWSTEVWQGLNYLWDDETLVEIEPAERKWLLGAPSAAVDSLRLLLQSEDEDLRYNAAFWLHEMEKADERVVQVLLPLLTSENIPLRFKAAMLLHQMSEAYEQVIQTLIAGLASENEAIRGETEDLLYEVDNADERVVTVLISHLASKDASTRYWAASWLHQIGKTNEQSIEVLLALLTDENNKLRYQAAHQLHHMGKANVLTSETLISWLATGNDALSNFAVHLLKEISTTDERVVEGLYSLLNSEDENLRYRVASLLHQMGKADGSVVEALLSLLTDRTGIIWYQALGLLRTMDKVDEKVIDILFTALLSGETYLRYHAAYLLNTLEKADERVIKTLFPMLSDEDFFVRYRAANLLQEVGKADEQVIEAFLKAAGVDTTKVLPLCQKILDEQPLTSQDVNCLRDVVLWQASATNEQNNARQWLFTWAYGQLEEQEALFHD